MDLAHSKQKGNLLQSCRFQMETKENGKTYSWKQVFIFCLPQISCFWGCLGFTFLSESDSFFSNSVVENACPKQITSLYLHSPNK